MSQEELCHYKSRTAQNTLLTVIIAVIVPQILPCIIGRPAACLSGTSGTF